MASPQRVPTPPRQPRRRRHLDLTPYQQVERVREVIRAIEDDRWTLNAEEHRQRVVRALRRALGEDTGAETPMPVVDLSAFDGRDDDERMVNALAWAEAVDGPVTIITGDAQLTELSVFGMPDITLIGRAL